MGTKDVDLLCIIPLKVRSLVSGQLGQPLIPWPCQQSAKVPSKDFQGAQIWQEAFMAGTRTQRRKNKLKALDWARPKFFLEPS